MLSLGTAAGFEAEVMGTAKTGFNEVTQPNLLCRLLILWAVDVLVHCAALSSPAHHFGKHEAPSCLALVCPCG